MRDLLLDDDFALSGAGELRQASAAESVRQEIGRLAEESGWVATPMTPSKANEVIGAVTDLLTQHPDVTHVGAVTIVTSGGASYVTANFDGITTEVPL